MIKSIKTIKFFTQYRDSNGTQHYEVQDYNDVTKMVTMMKDHIFMKA